MRGRRRHHRLPGRIHVAAELRPPERFPRHRRLGCGTRLPRRLSRHRHRLLQPLQGGRDHRSRQPRCRRQAHRTALEQPLPRHHRHSAAEGLHCHHGCREHRRRRGLGGRHAHADEVADALLFLASSESSWISGADIPIDGGLSSMVFRNYIAPAMAAAAQ
ncbi:SDR family oxidoreductase [Rhodococcus hoagii]|nr:SDR family oxidoreductase [Prescottella equi]